MKKIFTSAFLLGISFLGFAQIPTDSLVAHYSFSNHTDDLSGNQYNAKGENVQLVPDRYGNPDAAYDFNGQNSAIVSEKPHQVKFPFTVSLWMKVDDFGVNYHSIYESDEKDGVYSGFWINYSDKKHISCGYGNGLGYNNAPFRYTKASPENVLKEGEWHHVVVSFISSTNFQLYIDQEEIGGTYSGTAIDVKSFNTQSTFGRNNGHAGNQTHHGQLDDIYIYNKALTPRDIAFLYYETPKTQVCEPSKIAVTDTLIIDMIVTSSTNQLAQNTVKVYPNPTHSFITINTGKEDVSDYTVSIVTADGKEVYTSLMNTQELTVDLKTLGTTGLYFIRIVDNQNNIVDTRKIILK